MTRKVSTYGSPVTVKGVRPREGSVTRFAPFIALSGDQFPGSVHMTLAEARELAEGLMAEAELIDGEQNQ